MAEYKIGDRVPLPPKPTGRRMRDIVPNGEDFRSRIYGAHLRNQRDGLPLQEGDLSPNTASTNMMFAGLARRDISCPECGVDPGQPCISIGTKRAEARTRRGEPMEGVHYKRLMMAKRLYARKEP